MTQVGLMKDSGSSCGGVVKSSNHDGQAEEALLLLSFLDFWASRVWMVFWIQLKMDWSSLFRWVRSVVGGVGV